MVTELSFVGRVWLSLRQRAGAVRYIEKKYETLKRKCRLMI
jgi:hypothetical protein